MSNISKRESHFDLGMASIYNLSPHILIFAWLVLCILVLISLHFASLAAFLGGALLIIPILSNQKYCLQLCIRLLICIVTVMQIGLIHLNGVFNISLADSEE